MENFEAFNNFPGAVQQQQQQNPNYQNVQNISETASVSVPEDFANFKNFLEKAEDGNRLSNMFWGHSIFDQNQLPALPRSQVNPNNFGGFVVPREERRPAILEDRGLTYASLVPKNKPNPSPVGPIKEPNPSSFGPTNYPNPNISVGQTRLSYYEQNINTPILHNNSVGNYQNPYYYSFTGAVNGGGVPFPLLTPPAEENNTNFAHGPSAQVPIGGHGQSAQQSSQLPNFAHQPNQNHTYVRVDSSVTNNVEEWQKTPPPSWNYTQTGSVNRKSEFCFFQF